jgi:hypothetical protein
MLPDLRRGEKEYHTNEVIPEFSAGSSINFYEYMPHYY